MDYDVDLLKKSWFILKLVKFCAIKHIYSGKVKKKKNAVYTFDKRS